MADQRKSSADIRVRGVSLHSRGKTENGTLYLTSHHLIFSYAPVSTVGTPRESSDLSSQPSAPRNRPRPKEIWVPYPMVNHCVLRPGHSHGQTQRTHVPDHGLELPPNNDQAFPPVYGTSTYGRPSTDSAHLPPYSSSPKIAPADSGSTAHEGAGESGWPPALRIRRRDFQMMAFHFHHPGSHKSVDETAREVFYALRSHCCVDNVEQMHAFHFKPPQEESNAMLKGYDARREFARMGIGGKVADGPGAAWRLTDINHDYSYSKTYPSILCVPQTVSDNMLKYGGSFRSKARIPALTYLHSNGGSITRSSQPMVGVQSRRNPQDERLVSAIFSSHKTPVQSPEDSPRQHALLGKAVDPTGSSGSGAHASRDADVPSLPISHSETALDDNSTEQDGLTRKRVYGSTRRNLIVDARPKINALANRATGGGIEDTANYSGTGETPVEKFFLNIANIHVMRASLEKVTESFANSDYVDIRPDHEKLRKSAWLSHISNLLDGSEMVARVVGLGGSHVLVHCSDGWDRTAQVAALAEIMLDPYYRTLNGFVTLVQKDFLSFGHKFKDRAGIEGSEKWFEIENERITPSRLREGNTSETSSLNTLGSKALSGARTWFEKNRNSLFGQQNESRSSFGDDNGSRPPSPPPNPILHAPAPLSNSKDDKEQRMSEKEIAPIFHQWLDAVFQLHYHHPNAFEFNERFLRRLFYQVYSGQYGEFLFNCEAERSRNHDRTHSVWPHFLSRRQEFTNPEYTSKTEDSLLFPRRCGVEREIEVRWWSGLFQRKDEDMNTARSLAPPDPEPEPPSLSTQTSVASSQEDSQLPPGRAGSESAGSPAIKEARSMPNFGAMREGITSTFASLKVGSNSRQAPAVSSSVRPSLEQHAAKAEGPKGYINSPSRSEGPHNRSDVGADIELRQEPDQGDPLGASQGQAVHDFQTSRMDFAAFSQSTYSTR